MRNWATLEERRRKLKQEGDGVSVLSDITKVPSHISEISGLQGHVVMFPTEFLMEESFAPSSVQKESIYPKIFQ